MPPKRRKDRTPKPYKIQTFQAAASLPGRKSLGTILNMSRPLSRPSSPIKMNAFTKKVLSLIKSIPKGRVASYGQIAILAGKPQGSRGVGWILNSCTKTYDLPWQRVINSQGRISFPRTTKQYKKQKSLLLKEKVKFKDNDSIDLEKYGWKKKPAKIRRPKNQPKMFSED